MMSMFEDDVKFHEIYGFLMIMMKMLEDDEEIQETSRKKTRN